VNPCYSLLVSDFGRQNYSISSTSGSFTFSEHEKFKGKRFLFENDFVRKTFFPMRTSDTVPRVFVTGCGTASIWNRVHLPNFISRNSKSIPKASLNLLSLLIATYVDLKYQICGPFRRRRIRKFLTKNSRNPLHVII
jgi:hypothetical protein